MNAKKFLFAALSLVLLFALSACGGGGSSSKQGASGKSQVTLKMWGHQDPGFIAADKQMIKDFEAANPNIKIDYTTYPFDSYLQKLKASFAANSGPDIARISGGWAKQFSSTGNLVALPFGDTLKKNFYKAPLGGYLWKNKVYGVPLGFNLENDGMLVHPNMFKSKGLSYPKTWDQLVSDAKKLSQGNGKKVAGFDFVTSDNVTFLFLAMILQQGGTYWNSHKRVNFQSPEAIKAMTTLVNLVNVDHVTDYHRLGSNDEGMGYFFKGKSAMLYRGPWTIASAEKDYKAKPGKDFSYVAVPSFTNKPPYFAAQSGWGIVVNKNSKYTKAALKFAKFASQPKNEMKWDETSYNVPPQKSVAQNPNFVKKVPLMKHSLSILKYGKWYGPIWNRNFFFKQVNQEFVAICAGKDSVKSGLKKLQDKINQNLDANSKY